MTRYCFLSHFLILRFWEKISPNPGVLGFSMIFSHLKLNGKHCGLNIIITIVVSSPNCTG